LLKAAPEISFGTVDSSVISLNLILHYLNFIKMKKIILAALLMTTGICFVYSQDSISAIAFQGKKKEVDNPASTAHPVALSPGSVSPKALKDFSKTCKTASDCRWYSCGKEGVIVFYQAGDKKGRRFYDRKGNYVYNILSYGETLLPPDVKDIVKRTYYQDYKINWVEEVEADYKTFFIVHIANDKMIKNVSVYDGEINEVLSMNKSK